MTQMTVYCSRKKKSAWSDAAEVAIVVGVLVLGWVLWGLL